MLYRTLGCVTCAHSDTDVYMKDVFGGRDGMLHYLRTGELQHRMGRE